MAEKRKKDTDLAEVEEALEDEGPRVARRNALFPLGIGCYPLDDERKSWTDWYEGDVEGDFEAFSAARLSLVRVYVSWKYFEPQVGQYDDEAGKRLDAIVAAAKSNRLQLVVCFFADDRLAELTEVPWGKKRDPRTDSYMIGREVALVQRIVSKLNSEQAVFAWDLANEVFLSGFTSGQDLRNWVVTMRDAIRDIDSERPITMSADRETLFRATGIDPVDSLDLLEFVSSHSTCAYRSYAAQGTITAGPVTYLDSFLLRLARGDLPVLLDDIGVQTLEYSPAEEAAYVRNALYSALMNRAAGAVLRRFRDVDAERREPYFLDPDEVLVGVADQEGTPKPAMVEAADFARVIAHIDLRRYSMQQERCAILVPAERFEPLPSLTGLFGPRSALQAYVSAKEAHVFVDLVHEGEETGSFSMLVVPSAGKLKNSTWELLLGFVNAGGSVVMSYAGGDPDPRMRELFGMEHLGDQGAHGRLSCRVAQQGVLGELTPFDAPMRVPAYALLGQGGAAVVATDAEGNPLLTVNQFGQGRAVFMAAPLERALAQEDSWVGQSPVRSMLRTVYGAVAAQSGASAPYSCAEPRVETALFTSEDDDVLVLLNHSPERLTVEMTMERPVAAIYDVRGGSAAEVGGGAFGVPLRPNAAAALRLVYA